MRRTPARTCLTAILLALATTAGGHGFKGTLPIFVVPERVKRYVWVAVYDMLGRLVRTVQDGESQAGTGRAVWDRKDERGRRVAGGIYFCEPQAGGEAERRKLILVR